MSGLRLLLPILALAILSASPELRAGELSEDQKRIKKTWGTPFQTKSMGGGQVTWTFRYDAHAKYARNKNGGMLVIGKEYLTFYFTASGKHYKHTKRRETIEGNKPEWVVWQDKDIDPDEDDGPRKKSRKTKRSSSEAEVEESSGVGAMAIAFLLVLGVLGGVFGLDRVVLGR